MPPKGYVLDPSTGKWGPPKMKPTVAALQMPNYLSPKEWLLQQALLSNVRISLN